MSKLLNKDTILVLEECKVGNVVVGFDLTDLGKDGKPKMKRVRIESESTCVIVTETPKGHVNDYELCVFDMQPNDMTQSTLTRQLSTQPLSIAVWEQSTGTYDKNKKPIKRRVYFYLEDTACLSKDTITRVKGRYFDTYEEEKQFIEDLQKQGYYFITK